MSAAMKGQLVHDYAMPDEFDPTDAQFAAATERVLMSGKFLDLAAERFGERVASDEELTDFLYTDHWYLVVEAL